MCSWIYKLKVLKKIMPYFLYFINLLRLSTSETLEEGRKMVDWILFVLTLLVGMSVVQLDPLKCCLPAQYSLIMTDLKTINTNSIVSVENYNTTWLLLLRQLLSSRLVFWAWALQLSDLFSAITSRKFSWMMMHLFCQSSFLGHVDSHVISLSPLGHAIPLGVLSSSTMTAPYFLQLPFTTSNSCSFVCLVALACFVSRFFHCLLLKAFASLLTCLCPITL